MSPERELLRRVIDGGGSYNAMESLDKEIEEFLAQPEQPTNQGLIDDIEYLITAFEQGADADDYWRPISDLRDDLLALKAQVPVQQILEDFPLLDEEGLDEKVHHCEWVLQQERKRLHAMLSAQPEQEPVAWKVVDKTTGEFMFSRVNPMKRTYIYDDVIPLYTTPKREPPQTAREMYQRGYAAAERDLKRKPLSEDEIKVIINQLPTGVDLDTGIEFCRIIEKAHGIGGEE